MQVALNSFGSPKMTDSNLSPMVQVPTVADHFYRCQFQTVVGLLNSADLALCSEKDYIDLQLFKANALYEMQLVPQSMEILKSFGIFRRIECKASYNYSAGKLSYFETDYPAAEKYFSEIKFLTEDLKLQFRGQLGLANVYFTQEKDHLLPPLLAELSQMSNKVQAEDRISFHILLGSYYGSSKVDKVLARKYYHLALSEASKQSWIYFVNRALYNLAKLEKQAGNLKELCCLLEVLRASLKDSECVWMKFLINDQFKDSAINLQSKIEMDTCNMRLKIDDRWFEFHDKPLLFNFLKILHENKNFVTKAEIAHRLWPEQNYLPRTHDPRIFDIAKRVRSVIELYEQNPLILLSGRQGYKLAAAQSV